MTVTAEEAPSAPQRALKRRCLYLMISLLALMLVYPFFQGGPARQSVMVLLNSLTLGAGVYAVSETARHLIIALLIGIPQLVLAWAALMFEHSAAQTLSVALLSTFYGFALVRVVAYVLDGQQVTQDKIFGAVSVYLLMGLSWASAYTLIESLQPGSFFFAGSHTAEDQVRFPELLYLSFATLTTLGYGDVTPASALARSLASLEAVGGVLYLAVLVARLVSLYRPTSNRSK